MPLPRNQLLSRQILTLLLVAAALAVVGTFGRAAGPGTPGAGNPGAGAGNLGVIPPTSQPAGAGEYRFQHDPVLGTSLDLIVVAPTEEKAQAFEAAVLAEIERLCKILSTYDPDSEVSKLTVAGEPTLVSSEIIDVLSGYDTIRQRSSGAYNGQLGALVKTWKEAEAAGKVPDDATLKRLVAEMAQPAWQIDKAAKTVTRLNDNPLNLNSMGKGYILTKALTAARTAVPAVTGALLDIGGDVMVWGSAAVSPADKPAAGKNPWRIGIADPAHSQDNAPPLTEVLLTDQYIASSGSYERYYTIGGKRYSHIFDPRTGKPVEGIASATVIAKDGATANALATTLCVLTPAGSLALVRDTPGAECLIVGSDGKQYRSPGFAKFEAPRDKPADAGTLWPKGYEVIIDLTIKTPAAAKKYHRPYVAVWVEDAAGKPVRLLSVWGNAPKYWPSLTKFWVIGKTENNVVKTISRATRQPGQYSLTWDGKDDAGKAVAPGSYTIRVEARREGGGYANGSGKLDCLAKPAAAKIDANSEMDETKLTYGPRGTP
jgi:FAD:protein FMN transferase